jgi:hypothetical protein
VPLALSGATQLDFWEHLVDFISHDRVIRSHSDSNNVGWKKYLWLTMRTKAIPKEVRFAQLIDNMEAAATNMVNETAHFFRLVQVCLFWCY